MTEKEAKTLLIELIKDNRLANDRNAEKEKLVEVSGSWWKKCKFHQSKTEVAWTMCFDRAEERKQGLIKVYDFVLELEAWNTKREANKGIAPNIENEQGSAVSSEFQQYINQATRYCLAGQRPPLPHEGILEEYRDIFRNGTKKVKKWWLDSVGMV